MLSVIVPFACSFEKRINFWGNRKRIAQSIGIVAIGFIIWDAVFTRLGVWGFSPNYTLGIKIDGLPLEEILFFICIPYSCLFSYEVINYFGKKFSNKIRPNAFISMAVGCLVIAIIHYDKLYTLTAFGGAAIFLFLLRNQVFAFAFIRVYIITLIPFLIVNGILTGYITPEPVVWYNDAENLGIRLGTIPVEDFFYGMQLNGWVVWLYARGVRG